MPRCQGHALLSGLMLQFTRPVQEQSVREDALHLLELLSERFWRSAVTPRTPDGGLTPAGGSGIWALPVESADSATAGGSLPQVSLASIKCAV